MDVAVLLKISESATLLIEDLFTLGLSETYCEVLTLSKCRFESAFTLCTVYNNQIKRVGLLPLLIAPPRASLILFVDFPGL